MIKGKKFLTELDILPEFVKRLRHKVARGCRNGNLRVHATYAASSAQKDNDILVFLGRA